MRNTIRMLSSLWITFPVLLIIGIVLILLTFVPGGTDFSVGAIKTTVYRSWWFIGLIGILAVNLVACTIKRTPWKWVWQWGYMLTHTGILVIMIGAVLSLLTKEEGFVRIPEKEASSTLLLQDEHELIFYDSTDASPRKLLSLPVNFHPYKPQNPNKSVSLGTTGNHLTIEKIIPRAKVAPRIDNAGPEKKHLVRLIFSKEEVDLSTFELYEGAVEQHDMFSLVVYFDSYERGAPKQDAVIDLVKKGKLTLKALAAGSTQPVDFRARSLSEKPEKIGDVELRILSLDEEKGRALIEATFMGKARQLRIEAERPFDLNDEEGQTYARVLLYERPYPANVFILRSGKRLRYFYNGAGGKIESGEMEIGEKRPIRLPEGMTVDFRVEEHLDRAREFLSVEAVGDSDKGSAAMRLKGQFEGGAFEGWVAEYERRTWEVGGRRLEVLLVPRGEPLGFTVQLNDFEIERYPGSNSPSKYRSTVSIRDTERGVTLDGLEVIVNEPISYRGFTFYQASYEEGQSPHGPVYASIFQVSRDLGKPVVYLGFILTVLGCIYMFYLKPFIKKAYAAKAKGTKA